MRKILNAALAASLLGTSLWAQVETLKDPNPAPDPHHQQVFFNGRQVKMNLTLDRQSYFPGETMWVTISALNPSAGTLEVFDPLGARTAGFDLMKWGNRFVPGVDGWEPMLNDPMTLSEIDWSAPTVTLGPGQSTAQSHYVLSYRGRCPQCKSDGAVRDAPSVPGRYRLSYCYAQLFLTCSHAEFTIEQATVVQWATTRLNNPEHYTDPATGQPKEQQLFLHALSLASAGSWYVGVSRGPTGQPDILADPTGPVDWSVVENIEPYDRVAQASAVPTSLTVRADPQDNITVQWMENGQQKAYCLDKNRVTIQACAPLPPMAISISPQSVTLEPSQSQQFTATVSNSSNTAVTWGTNPSETPPRITDSGLYTAGANLAVPLTQIV